MNELRNVKYNRNVWVLSIPVHEIENISCETCLFMLSLQLGSSGYINFLLSMDNKSFILHTGVPLTLYIEYSGHHDLGVFL